jgi:ABC-2 type transport system ATP-binding protein/lipopolysaccharide transport system ATP-binding protein
MTQAAVSLSGVSKRFHLAKHRRDSLKERFVRGRAEKDHDFWALKDATFDIPQGATFGFVGPNGSGKSTTLKVIAGIYRPTTGSVRVQGRLSALLELGAGFHPELTGRENIRLNASILGLNPSEIDAATEGIIDFADLGEHIDAPVKVYSSGMYVRLGFAIAVAVDPEILVIDEVIAVGDEEFQRKCFDHLHALKRKGTTIVLVSHSLATIEGMCDEAVWVDGGSVRAQGQARRVVRSYVDHVNQVEEIQDVETGLTHYGSGEALIKKLEFQGESGAFVPGSPLAVTLTYEAKEAIDDVIVGLAFINEAGVRVAGPNSQEGGLLHLPTGEGEVRFECDELVLMPGRYRVSAGIVTSSHFIDNVVEQFELVVRPAGGTETGNARMPGRWSVHAGVLEV